MAATRWGLLDALDARRRPLPWPGRLVIVGPGGLGDTVLLLPLLRRIQAASPATRITWIGRRAYAPILAMLGVPDYQAGEDLLSSGFALRGHDAMLSVADLGADFFGGMAKLEAVPVRIGPASARARPRWWNHLVHASRFGLPRHEAQRDLRLLLPFGAGQAATAAELHRGGVPAPVGVRLPDEIPAHGHVVLHPFSMGHAREWPIVHWVALARELAAQGRAVVFTGSAAEGERLAAAWPLAQRPADVVDAFGRLDLAQLTVLLAGADAVLACSTGPLHLAAALGTPTLGLFVPRKGLGVERWAALGPAAVSVQERPACGRRCQNGACPCIEALAPQRIALALARPPRRPPDTGALAGWHLAPRAEEPVPAMEST